TPLRWQRDDLHLDRLPEQDQSRMEEEGGHKYLGKLADWDRWQRQRRRGGPNQAIPGCARVCGVGIRSPKQNALCGGEEFVWQVRKAISRIYHRGAGDGGYS